MGHIHDKIDFIVNALIVHDDRVLLVFHTQLQRWLPVGGHVELDEEPNQALVREIREESSIEVGSLQIAATKPTLRASDYQALFPPNFLDIHTISRAHRHVGLVYVLKSDTSSVALAAAEHEQIRWFTESDLQQEQYALLEGVRYYAHEALQMAKDSSIRWEPLA